MAINDGTRKGDLRKGETEIGMQFMRDCLSSEDELDAIMETHAIASPECGEWTYPFYYEDYQKMDASIVDQMESHGQPHKPPSHIEGARTAKESNQKWLGERLAIRARQNWPTPRRQPRQSQARNGRQDTSGGSEDTQWPARPGEEQYEWEEPRVTETQSQLGGGATTGWTQLPQGGQT